MTRAGNPELRAQSPEHEARRAQFARTYRVTWTVVTFVIVEVLVCGLSAFPVVLGWSWLLGRPVSNRMMRLAMLGLAVVPSYVLFAVCLMVVSALATRLAGWRTPRDAVMRIADLGWPLLGWARYMATIHIVRVIAGTLFRGSPIWTAYLRWSGARLGRGVYIASVSLSDYNLLEFGDDVVIGGDVHVAGHTVEGGIIRTAGVRLGRNVTVGLGSVVEIGVDVGSDCEIGALSFVPKYSKLEAGGVYAGAPVRRLGEADPGE